MLKQSPNKKILSDITVHMKYSKYLDSENRRENWDEICERNMQMHLKKHLMKIYLKLEQDYYYLIKIY